MKITSFSFVSKSLVIPSQKYTLNSNANWTGWKIVFVFNDENYKESWL